MVVQGTEEASGAGVTAPVAVAVAVAPPEG